MIELYLSLLSCRNPALHRPYLSVFAVRCVDFPHPVSLYHQIKGCPSIVDLDISKTFDKVTPDVAVDLIEKCGLYDNIAQ